MIQKDYILRLIEQLVNILLKITGLKKDKDYKQALLFTKQSFQKLLGIDSELINSLSWQDLIKMLKLTGAAGIAKCIALAELLKEEASIYDAQGDSGKSYLSYLKSLNIFLSLFFDAGKIKPKNHSSKIEQLFTKLKNNAGFLPKPASKCFNTMKNAANTQKPRTCSLTLSTTKKFILKMI